MHKIELDRTNEFIKRTNQETEICLSLHLKSKLQVVCLLKVR